VTAMRQRVPEKLGVAEGMPQAVNE
jgi:hypothetical protein